MGHKEADIACINSNGIQEAPTDTLYKKTDESWCLDDRHSDAWRALFGMVLAVANMHHGPYAWCSDLAAVWLHGCKELQVDESPICWNKQSVTLCNQNAEQHSTWTNGFTVIQLNSVLLFTLETQQ